MNSEENSEWIVRVGEKEYGPVDLAALQEWREEGRVLPANDVRPAGGEEWIRAEAVPGLFAPLPLPEEERPALEQRRSFSQLIRDSVGIYRRAFLPFFLTAVLVAAPRLLFELTSPSYGLFARTELVPGVTIAQAVALLALTFLVVCWPIFLAAMQLETLAVLRGRPLGVVELWRQAVALFPRFALLCLLVYGSYFFWTALPVLASVSLVSAGPSLVSLLLALLLLAGQVFMVGRLFVNFMFWQQSAAISGLSGHDAIRESKMLARSKRRPRRAERPLWRAVLLASLWFALALGMTAGADLPILLSKLQHFTTPEELMSWWQTLNSPHSPDPGLIAGATISALLQTLVRPTLAIAFVLLYFDARTDFSPKELEALDVSEPEK